MLTRAPATGRGVSTRQRHCHPPTGQEQAPRLPQTGSGVSTSVVHAETVWSRCPSGRTPARADAHAHAGADCARHRRAIRAPASRVLTIPRERGAGARKDRAPVARERAPGPRSAPPARRCFGGPGRERGAESAQRASALRLARTSAAVVVLGREQRGNTQPGQGHDRGTTGAEQENPAPNRRRTDCHPQTAYHLPETPQNRPADNTRRPPSTDSHRPR
jgi:hypothetical protein